MLVSYDSILEYVASALEELVVFQSQQELPPARRHEYAIQLKEVA